MRTCNFHFLWIGGLLAALVLTSVGLKTATADDDLETRREAVREQDEMLDRGAPAVPPPVAARPLTYRASDQTQTVFEPVRWRRSYWDPSYRYYYGRGPRYYSGYRGYYYPRNYDRYYYGGPRYYDPYRYRAGIGPLRFYWR